MASDRQQVFDAIVEAHHLIRQFVDGAQTADDDELEASLLMVAEIMPTHFAYEEREDGFIDRVRRAHRDGDEQADKLLSEHKEFLILAGDLTGGEVGPGWKAKVRDLAVRLGEHERAEARLGSTASP